MKKQISEQDISRLISRFMDGDTTLAEERLLADYFRTARHTVTVADVQADVCLLRQRYGLSAKA